MGSAIVEVSESPTRNSKRAGIDALLGYKYRGNTEGREEGKARNKEYRPVAAWPERRKQARGDKRGKRNKRSP